MDKFDAQDEQYVVKQGEALEIQNAVKRLQHAQDLFYSTNGQMVLIGAHRYALGRATYAVSCIAEWLLQNRDSIEDSTRFTMVRDTVEALNRDMAGMDCDRKVWMHFVRELLPTLSPEQRVRVEDVRE